MTSHRVHSREPKFRGKKPARKQAQTEAREARSACQKTALCLRARRPLKKKCVTSWACMCVCDIADVRVCDIVSVRV